MKQFRIIFTFELKQYLKNRLFVGITAFLIVLAAVAMFFPRLFSINGNEDTWHIFSAHEENSVMLIKAEDNEVKASITDIWEDAFPNYTICLFEDSISSLKEEIVEGRASCAFVFNNFEDYTYYVNNLSMYDYNTETADAVLRNIHQVLAMTKSGMTEIEIHRAMSANIRGNIYTLGVDQGQNYLYTYIMIFALYLVILLYGRMIATNVATEKSSRVMEILITSTNPISLIFGKVMASCLAGFIQLLTVFGSCVVFYRINADFLNSHILESLFNIPTEQLAYLMLFFVLGFLIYAFLYGAVGSFATKLEDINTSVLPLTFLLIIAFMVVLFSISSGHVDNLVMIICSYIPLTSPIAMYARISMSTVSFAEILVSILALIASTILTGFFAAKTYRIGVLLYGTPAKMRTIIRTISKKNSIA